jgi:dihydroorotase
MANTDPVADTAGVVEQVLNLGRLPATFDVDPSERSRSGSGGQRLAELGAMADSAARVGVLRRRASASSDACSWRAATEYVKAFDGVVAQHARSPGSPRALR